VAGAQLGVFVAVCMLAPFVEHAPPQLAMTIQV
jgi:hypothetical protein